MKTQSKQQQLSIVQTAVLSVLMIGAGSVMALDSSTGSIITSSSNSGFIANVVSESTQGRSVAVIDGMYAANAKVGRLDVEVQNTDVLADGRSELLVKVTVYDLHGAILKEPVLITIENTGGIVQLLGTPDDEFGNTRKDADLRVPGTQLKILDGRSSFGLIAPSVPQDVKLRLTAGNAYVTGVIPFALDLREMVASGLIEGVLRFDRKHYASTVSPVRVDDGFEQELSRLTRSKTNHNDIRTVAGRAAFFLKGKISGQTLLTMSYDSDKETRARLLRDIKPEQMYPIYGDASIKGFEARSSERLYIRVDKDRSFALYGDYNTGDGFSQSVGTGIVSGSELKQLGTYNRSLTGVKAHVEGKHGFVNAFGAYDTLKNVTEELRANGTSGPFAVKNTTALENSEKIEVLVRDKNDINKIVSVTPLMRLNDYVFEPFSSRILLNRPVPSLDAEGNPMSLRISYEVDQGGEKYAVYGVEGDVNVGKIATVGAAYVEDKNPIGPVKLASIHAGVKLGDKTKIVAELAQSETGTSTLPVAIPAINTVPLTTHEGKALRVELMHQGDTVQGRAYYKKTEAGFMNTSAGAMGSGTEQIGANATVKVTPRVSVDGDIQRTDSLDSHAHRTGGRLGVNARLNTAISVKAGIKASQEEGVVAGSITRIGCNSLPGSEFAPNNSGGFSGANSSQLLNVNGDNDCGLSLNNGLNQATTSIKETNSQTVYLGADVSVTPKLNVTGQVEFGRSETTLGNGLTVNEDMATRLELGAGYQVSERTRLYVRADTQRGLASNYSLNTASKSSAVSFGVDSTYMQGGNIFSEYRLRDAMSADREVQWATGLRNAWQLNEGWLLTTGLERLKILSGGGQNATAATLGLDYTGSNVWKGSTRLEWRRLDSTATQAIKQQDTLMWTVNAARKLDKDWTLLARNYYLATNNHGAQGNAWQDRFQLGFAYRPVKHNTLDALGKLEYKTETNINGQNDYRRVLVGATQVNYHPSRPWWISGRLAAKSVTERYPDNQGGGMDSYKAYLVSGRLIYDITEQVDLGLNVSFMSGRSGSQQGSSVQKGIGVEVGYSMTSNLWASVGYNFTGYTDKDLTSDYTGHGAYLRLRYKFDQDVFQYNNPKINNTLER